MISPCLVISKGYLEMEFSVFSVLVWVYFVLNLKPNMLWIIFKPRDLFQSLTKDYPKNKISQDSLVTFLSKYKTRHLCWKNTMLSQETGKLWVHHKFMRKMFSIRDPAVAAVVSQPLCSWLWYRFALTVASFVVVFWFCFFVSVWDWCFLLSI